MPNQIIIPPAKKEELSEIVRLLAEDPYAKIVRNILIHYPTVIMRPLQKLKKTKIIC